MEQPFNITSLFYEAVQRYPNKVALIDKHGNQMLYEDLKIQVQYTAAYFKDKGIMSGDRVLTFVPMGIDLYRVVLALFSIGATVVFVDQWSDVKRLNICCEIAECKAFVGHWKAHLLRFFSKEIRRIPLKLGVSYREKTWADLHIDPGDAAALITFTTGSTGIPKAVLRSHRFLYEQFTALEEELQAKPSDVDMSVLPIVLLINLAIGSTSVIADFDPSKPTKIDAAKVVRQLDRHKVSRIVASPYFVKRLAHYVVNTVEEVQHVQDIFTGGAPVFQQEANGYLKGFPNANIRILYGSTEAEPISAISASELIKNAVDIQSNKGLSVGIPYHGIQLRIIDITEKALFDISEDEFHQIQKSDGTWGEIVVTGAHVLAQYYKNDAALMANKIRIGETYWHRTGDSGYLKDGRLYLTGRCRTLIQRKGGWVSPFIFENHIQSVVCVEMGTILEIKGNICAFVELTKDNWKNRDRVHDFLRTLPYQVIRVKFIKLPRDPRHHSKIEYDKLRQDYI